jgi:pilus assembly protein Flp/PilA
MSNWLRGRYGQIRSLWSEEQGQGLTEYALILALVALVAIVALALIGGEVTSQLTSVGSSFPN